MDSIYISFLWHMHQPYYKNSYTGKYLLPWVLLHGTKDYYDMGSMLMEFEGMKQNFNFVPSLLKQLKDYERDDVKDSYLEVFKKHPRDLTDEDKVFLLTNFFNANRDNMVRPFPRYYELLGKRGFYCPRDAVAGTIDYFSEEELRDIQVLFFLAWIDPVFFRAYDGLRHLKEKGRSFSEDDKETLREVQKEILGGIVPLYRDLASRGIVEISTSPFYHPIIPLVIDTRSARESIPDVTLPEVLFSRPEDASHQIAAGASLFEKTFGARPQGMWPPEGSVSDEALQLYMENGVKWLATDEDILFESLKWGARRDGSGALINPEILFRPYRYEKKDKNISLVFRDQSLSDLISFHYARMDPKDAAQDCLKRLAKIHHSLRGKVKKPLVTIAMDGENAWEGYRNDGRDFLQYLYEGILRDESVVPVTISEYLRDAEDYGSLYHCFAGSWIGHNFSVWIGHPEDNAGWKLLAEAREVLGREDPEKANEMAWESIYIAEGSDWFWWYGDDHSSDDDEIFDLLFRENLANVYRYLGKEVPEALSIPIITEERVARPTREPVNFLRPTIDGMVTNYFEWIGSGFLEGKGHGVAMHEAVSLITGCHYGFNDTHLFLRLDLDRAIIEDLKEMSFEIVIIVGGVSRKIQYSIRDGLVDNDLRAQVSFGDVLELAVPFEELGAKRSDELNIWLSLKVKDMVIDRIPQRGYLVVTVPSETFEAEMWYV